jgi:hypothetical protein
VRRNKVFSNSGTFPNFCANAFNYCSRRMAGSATPAIGVSFGVAGFPTKAL